MWRSRLSTSPVRQVRLPHTHLCGKSWRSGANLPAPLCLMKISVNFLPQTHDCTPALENGHFCSFQCWCNHYCGKRAEVKSNPLLSWDGDRLRRQFYREYNSTMVRSNYEATNTCRRTYGKIYF